MPAGASSRAVRGLTANNWTAPHVSCGRGYRYTCNKPDQSTKDGEDNGNDKGDDSDNNGKSTFLKCPVFTDGKVLFFPV